MILIGTGCNRHFWSYENSQWGIEVVLVLQRARFTYLLRKVVRWLVPRCTYSSALFLNLYKIQHFADWWYLPRLPRVSCLETCIIYLLFIFVLNIYNSGSHVTQYALRTEDVGHGLFFRKWNESELFHNNKANIPQYISITLFSSQEHKASLVRSSEIFYGHILPH